MGPLYVYGRDPTACPIPNHGPRDRARRPRAVTGGKGAPRQTISDTRQNGRAIGVEVAAEAAVYVGEMKAAGKSVRAIAEALGISVGSVHGMLKAAA